MRFHFLKRLAGLAATLSIAASALGSELSYSGTLTSSDSLSPFYVDAVGQLASGGLTGTTPLVPATSASPSSGNWLSAGFSAAGYGSDSPSAYGSSSGSGYGADDLSDTSDDFPRRGVAIFVGYDTWRGVADGNWQNNGIHTGLNYGTRLGRFSDLTGVGFQIGGSVGAYNWAGTDYRLSHQDEAQPQGFVTYGVYHRASEDSNWTAGLVQDWMLNSNYGVFAQNPTISQWRGQVGYATSALNEFGIWGTWRSMGDDRTVPGFGLVSWRAVNQISAYWHYKFGPGGADTSIWVGLPEHDRLAGGGSLGDWLAGALANVPLSNRFALYALVTYMHPSSAAGPLGAKDEFWNFSTGVSFYPARNARSSAIGGQRWMPLLPVANNGYFMVDQSQNY